MKSKPPHTRTDTTSDDIALSSMGRGVGVSRNKTYLLLGLLGGWFLISFLSVGYFTNKRLESDLKRYSAELNQTATAVTYHFERSLSFLHVIPATVADNQVVISAINSIKSHSLSTFTTPDEKRAYLNGRADTAKLNWHGRPQSLQSRPL